MAARSNTIGKLRQLVESQDNPKKALLDALGDIQQTDKVMHCQVLVAVYAGRSTHAGTSILKADRALQEQQYQGCVGLVVAMGPGAYLDGPGAQFHGVQPRVGDWILFRPSDGMQTSIRSVPCRIFDDVNIKMVVADPEDYY